MTSYLPTFALIAALYLLSAASPGPNVFIISQLSLAGERKRALRVVSGVALGTTIWSGATMAGLAALLLHVVWLGMVLKFAGAACLVWYGGKLLLGSLKKTDAGMPALPPHPPSRDFSTGLLTCLTNPKSGVFWTSVFTATLPAGAPLWFYVALQLMISTLSLSWYGSMALLFAAKPVQAAFGRVRRQIDAVCGTLLVGLGLRLAFDKSH